MAAKPRAQARFEFTALIFPRWGKRVSLHIHHGESIMLKSSRHLARAACALLVSVGASVAAAQPVIIEKAMPAPIVEVIPAAPGAGYNWVPGHWAWRGGAWFWVKGHHVRGVVAAMPAPIVEVVPARPSPTHVWIKGHHVYEGGRWVWHPGVWFRG